MAQQENILERWADVQRDAFQPSQIGFPERLVALAAIQQEEPAHWRSGLVKSHGHQRTNLHLRLRGSRDARQILQCAPVAPVPTKARPGPYEAVPAKRGF